MRKCENVRSSPHSWTLMKFPAFPTLNRPRRSAEPRRTPREKKKESLHFSFVIKKCQITFESPPFIYARKFHAECRGSAEFAEIGLELWKPQEVFEERDESGIFSFSHFLISSLSHCHIYIFPHFLSSRGLLKAKKDPSGYEESFNLVSFCKNLSPTSKWMPYV